MPSYGNGSLKVKTVGDLRNLVKKLDGIEDDYKLVITPDNLFTMEEYTLNDDIDVSYSERIVDIGLDIMVLKSD